MKSLVKLVVGVLSALFLIGLKMPDVHAAETDFSVVPVLSETNGEIPSYFDLRVSPNQKQTLQIRIMNQADAPKNFKVHVRTAATNNNGIVDYSLDDFSKDPSMTISLKDLIKVSDPQVEVPAKGEKIVSMDLTMPEQLFQGILLGGVTVEPIVPENTSAGVHNLFTRTLAIQLQESDQPVSPDVQAGAVRVSQDNLRNNVQLEMRNVSPVLLSKITAEISITKKGEKEPFLQAKKEKLSFAPNTKFYLTNSWNEHFTPGDYTYNIKLADEKNHKWEFSKDFNIKEETAEKYNNKSVDKKGDLTLFYILFGIAGFVILLALLLFFLYRKKAGKKEE